MLPKKPKQGNSFGEPKRTKELNSACHKAKKFALQFFDLIFITRISGLVH